MGWLKRRSRRAQEQEAPQYHLAAARLRVEPLEPGRSDSPVRVTLSRPSGDIWVTLTAREAVELAAMLLASSTGGL